MKKFRDLLLNEKELSELESDLRILKDRQKNVPKNHPNATPARQGEIAARLDDEITNLEERIKKVKDLSPSYKNKKNLKEEIENKETIQNKIEDIFAKQRRLTELAKKAVKSGKSAHDINMKIRFWDERVKILKNKLK